MLNPGSSTDKFALRIRNWIHDEANHLFNSISILNYTKTCKRHIADRLIEFHGLDGQTG